MFFIFDYKQSNEDEKRHNELIMCSIELTELSTSASRVRERPGGRSSTIFFHNCTKKKNVSTSHSPDSTINQVVKTRQNLNFLVLDYLTSSITIMEMNQFIDLRCEQKSRK